MAYFPNGTAGEVLDRQCWSCPFGEEPCVVWLVQMEHNYGQCDKGQEKLRAVLSTLITEDGTCQVRKQLQAHSFVPADEQLRLPHTRKSE